MYLSFSVTTCYLFISIAPVNLFIVKSFSMQVIFLFFVFSPHNYKLNYRLRQIVLCKGDSQICWHAGSVDYSAVYPAYKYKACVDFPERHRCK